MAKNINNTTPIKMQHIISLLLQYLSIKTNIHKIGNVDIFECQYYTYSRLSSLTVTEILETLIKSIFSLGI